MTKREVCDLIDFLSSHYKYFEPTKGMIDSWYEVLECYDKNDVKRSLENLMSEDKFQNQPPTVYLVVKGLSKSLEKVDISDVTMFCSKCGRGFHTREELEKHFDRCFSVQYIIREYKKHFGKELDKRVLYELSEKDFKEKYESLLTYIMNNTKDDAERMRINFYFNQPNQDEQLKFLNHQ